MITSKEGHEFDQGSRLEMWPFINWEWGSKVRPRHLDPKHPLLEKPFRIAEKYNLKDLRFDGNFMKKDHTFHYYYSMDPHEKTQITSLPMFPMHFCPENLRQMYVARGLMFWACRRQKYVSYTGWDVTKREYFVSIAMFYST
jgi:hypothetical protein